MVLTEVGGVVAVLLLLVVGDLVFKRVYSAPEQADEEHKAETEDGLEVAVYRHTPETASDGGADTDAETVLLVHGISVGHRNMNFDDENGMAQYLSEHGYDCWAVDLRGRGGSDVPDSPWGFDDYVRYDLPAVIDYVLEETGSDGLHWVGHSMGGMLLYPVAGAEGYDNRLRSAVALAPPVQFRNQPFLSYISRIGISTSPLLSRIKRLQLLPYTSRLLSVFLAVWPNSVVVWLANKRNVEYTTLRRASTCVVARLCPNILLDFAGWIVDDEWTSEDGEDYHEATRRVETPTLVMAGDTDTLCPVRNVRPGYRRLGSDDKEFVVVGDDIETENGYAHADLVFGENAREEVFPHVRDWLDGH